MVCPWNKFASPSGEPDFAVRNGLDDVTLVELFSWTEEQFERKLAGSAIHRIGYERWLRNLAIGLGNAPKSASVVDALKTRVINSRDVGDVLRNYRNFVHPAKQLSENVQLVQDDAILLWEISKAVTRQLLKTTKPLQQR